MYANVVFAIRCVYCAVSLTLVKEERFIRIIYYVSIVYATMEVIEVKQPWVSTV